MKISRIVIGLAVAALPAMCTTILPSDGSWYTFTWTGAPPTTAFGGLPTITGNLGTTLVGNPSGTTFNFSGPTSIFLQDLFYDGDQFEVFVDSVSQGTTSSPFNDATFCGNDPAGCINKPKFSSGTFDILGAGPHTLQINVIAETNNLSSGNAVFNLSPLVAPEVPEPATLGFVGLGLAGLALRLRRKRA